MPELPDADALALSIIRTAFPAAKVGTQIPADLLASLPFGLCARFGGAAVDPRFLDRATFDVQTFGGSRKVASDFAYDIREAFRLAAANQTVYPLGHVARYREVTAPTELRTADQADGLWRFQATYSLFLRPATV